MTRTPARVTQADIARAFRVAQSAGMTVRVLPDGSILIVPVDDKTDRVDFAGEVRL